MRRPNYDYLEDPKGGWEIKYGTMLVWGRTKAAARSRLLRMLLKGDQQPKGNEGEGDNDQS